MSIEKGKVLNALSTVKDPTTGQDILSVHMVESLKIDGDSVTFNLVLPNLNNDFKTELNFACQSVILNIYPSAKVNVHMVSKTPEPNAPAPKANNTLPHIKNIIAVASGKGGVGKSTVSTNLALGLKKMGLKVGLLDADLYGPSIPTMFGLQGQRPKVQDFYGKPKILPLEAFGIPVMSIGFIIEPEQAVVLRGPRLAAIIKQFVNDVVWPPLDYLIVDLPPGTGDIQLTLVQAVPVTGSILVTTPQEVAVADAVKAMNMFLLPNINVPIIGVVENMSWFTPAELPDNKYLLFGEGGGKRMAHLSNSVLLGQVPIVQGIREGGDAGKPIITDEKNGVADTFLEIAKNTVKQVSWRNEFVPPTEQVQVN
ncbi:MAG: Mrp/NBP35 family ATP-binding protein [Saprospiraceae bacterium]|jgi:ATP-binding protein involved in chromosome partitioning|nr:Mrp/NBP35 family ATP-binding protein [Saprospiraceae bacterium]